MNHHYRHIFFAIAMLWASSYLHVQHGESILTSDTYCQSSSTLPDQYHQCAPPNYRDIAAIQHCLAHVNYKAGLRYALLMDGEDWMDKIKKQHTISYEQ